jgi:hemin uptake protein HemP
MNARTPTPLAPTAPATASGLDGGAATESPRAAPLSSEQLLGGRRLVEIAHNGEVYRLQATRLGKLILTK